MSRLFICTDGSAVTGKHSAFDSAAAYVIFTEENVICKGSKLLKDRTNNYAEMYAVFKAIKECLFKFDVSKYDEVIITTDSELTQKTLTNWILGWIKNSDDEILVNSTGVPAKNQELIKSTFINVMLLQMRTSVYICHVNSHKSEKEIPKMYEKFKKQIDISLDEFKKIVQGNNVCDILAKKELGIN